MNKLQLLNDVLKGIGIPPSPENLRFMQAWSNSEGGTASFNPLNTTWSVPGKQTLYNSAGVKNYADYQTGVNATILTLKQSYYNNIKNALRSAEKAEDYFLKFPGIISDISTWGTNPYTIKSNLQTVGEIIVQGFHAYGIIFILCIIAGITIVLIS
jgi:hypothetical protein